MHICALTEGPQMATDSIKTVSKESPLADSSKRIARAMWRIDANRINAKRLLDGKMQRQAR